MAAVEPVSPTVPAAGSPSLAPALVGLGRRVRPVALAGERRLIVGGPLGELLPDGGIQRGSVVTVEGAPGAGVTTVALALVAAATAAGEWAAVVEPGLPTLGVAAAHEAGVDLHRLAVVAGVPRDQWGAVLAALVEGTSLVVAVPPPGGVRPLEARRLLPRLRERGGIVVAAGPWPERAAVRLHVNGVRWSGLGADEVGHLAEPVVDVEVEARGRPPRSRAWPSAR